MKPGDRLITALVGSHRAGETFKEWLLHVTIVAWFHSERSSEDLASALREALRDIPPFTATLGGEEHLGYKGKALVNLVRLPSPFIEIEKRVAATLEAQGVRLLVGRGSWQGDFKPHVTIQRSARLQEGDSFVCDRLYIVSQQGEFKKIDAEVPLGKS